MTQPTLSKVKPDGTKSPRLLRPTVLIVNCVLLNLLLGGIVFCGCATRTTSDRHIAEFKRKHPAESSRYVLIEPAFRELSIHDTMFFRSYIRATLSRIHKEVTPNSSAADLIEQYQKANEEDFEREIEALENMDKAIRSGGRLYHYEFIDGDNEESGLIVLRDSEITFRCPKLFEAPETKARKSSK
jgi:hypothetical protein